MYLHFWCIVFNRNETVYMYIYHDGRVFLGYDSNKNFQKRLYSKSFFTKSPDHVVAARASVLMRVRLCFMYLHKGSSMAKCNKINQYMNKFWLVLKLVMLSECSQGYLLRSPWVIIAFDLNTFLFVQTISFDLIRKTVSYYKSESVIWYRIELILYLELWQLALLRLWDIVWKKPI